MSFEGLLKTIRNVVAIDRATSTHSSGLRIGQTLHLSDPDADRLLRVTGFSGPGLGGRWTDGATASIDLKLAPESAGICRLRLQMMPFVTQTEGQTLRLRCGKGEERVEHFSPGGFAWTTVDLPLGDVRADALARIQIRVGRTFVPSKLGLSSDSRALGVLVRQIELLAERRLGILLHRLEFVAGFSRFRSTARWALRSLLNAPHRIVWRLREFLNRPVVERLTQVENQIRNHRGAFRAEPRQVAIEQLLVRLEQLIAAVNEKTDVVLNRTSRFLFPVDDNLVLVRSMVGYLYCSRNDHAVLSCLAESGEFEPGLRRLLERVLEPGMVFLDVGAHLGLHTLAAARRVGKSGRVFSFEPTPTTYKLLCQTLRLNALDDCVTARRVAVGREDTTKPLYVGTISGQNSLYPLPGVETTVEVEVVQLDNELPPAQHVDVAKIDVEGAELDVLCGMSRIIAENPGILIIAEYGPAHLARAGISSPDWRAVFSNHGFTAYVIEEPSGHCVPIDQVDLSDVFSVNIAFIRPTSPLLSPLEANVL